MYEMRINLIIPSNLADFVNSQRGAKSVQSYLIELIAEKKLSQNYEGVNDQETKTN
jgi:hypothetical protein